jgi:hypothetical protein
MRKLINKEFENLSKMTTKEYLLFRKWEEIHNTPWTGGELSRIADIKKSVWIPKDRNDYENLNPMLITVDENDKSQVETWLLLRKFVSRMPWNQNVGRIQRHFVVDRKTRRYLGVISLASDFMALTPRDEWIGWSTATRQEPKGKLCFTAMASSLVPTQPFGYLYTGGKLITYLSCSNIACDRWNKKYPEQHLMGITTTSLYGGGATQYSGMKYWKSMKKSTTGQISLEPSQKTMTMLVKWMKEKHPNDYKNIYSSKGPTGHVATRPKGRLLARAYTILGVKPPIAYQPRGVYFCRLYKGTRKFLSHPLADNFTMPLEPLFDNRLPVLVDLWKTKHAGKRAAKILDSPPQAFYDDLLKLSWPETKEKYKEDI